MLVVLVGILSILVILLLCYIIFFQLQLRNINRQLTKRLKEHTRQPITLELINMELNTLALNVNKCLEAEENLRLDSIRGEKRFKELIANISHDLRTPLTAIRGYQQLMEKGALSEEQMKKLKIAQKHANELSNLIERFFEYTYIANAEPKLNIEKINLTNLLTDYIAMTINKLEEKNLAVHFEGDPSIFVSADKEMVTRIIQNLISNSVQYSSGDIEVSLMTKDKAIVTFRNPVKKNTVIDLNQVFDRFYTGDNARSNSTGLGLAIVKLLAQLMGGNTGGDLQDNMISIWVELPIAKN